MTRNVCSKNDRGTLNDYHLKTSVVYWTQIAYPESVLQAAIALQYPILHTDMMDIQAIYAQKDSEADYYG